METKLNLSQYTRGEWKVGEAFDKGAEYPVYSEDGYELARVFIHSGEQKSNAHLIAGAVNACASVNPDNPMAVAEAIKPMYEALKKAISQDGWLYHSDIIDIQKILAQAERIQNENVTRDSR